MAHKESTHNHREGSLREQLATYFLTVPSPRQLPPTRQSEYWEKLRQLGQLEQEELLTAAGMGRPLVWGNPAQLLQAFLSAGQRLGARLGQPVLLFPAKDTAIGADTLLHPRVLTVTTAALLRQACQVAQRRPVWVRLQEHHQGLAVAVSGPEPFLDPGTQTLTKECTRLHGGSLVHSDCTVMFTCGQAESPPPGVHLYGCPTEEELLQDTLSPVWSVFYAGLYSSSPSSSSSMNATKESASEEKTSSTPESRT